MGGNMEVILWHFSNSQLFGFVVRDLWKIYILMVIYLLNKEFFATNLVSAFIWHKLIGYLLIK